MNAWTKTKDPRIKKRDGFYWARFSKRGKRVEQSLETKSFDIAKSYVEKIEAQILMGRSWKRERQLFSEAWLEFLIDKRQGNKVRPARERTMYEYTAFGDRFYLKFFGEMRLSDIDDHSWRDFVEWVRLNHGDIRFFNIKKYFQGFLTWAKRQEKILTPPYLFDPDGVKNKEREEFTPGKAYTREELKLLRDESEKHEKFHLVMLMCQYMGMRPSEVTQLNKDRINLKLGIIALKRKDTKTNTSRDVPIHPVVLPLLKAEMALGSTGPLFPNRNDSTRPMDPTGFKKVWSAVREATGIEGRFYDFRHTFITFAIADGMNPVVVAMITGTSIRVIQKHYLHLSDKDLGQAIAKLKL